MQATLTGHLVFSTLHTNDAAGATTRLLDMGVEPFLVSSSVEGILAQRLVRRVCPDCAQPFRPDPADLPTGFAFDESDHPRKGAGCRNCRNTGYRGRIGIYELLQITDELRELIMHRKNAHEIAAAAVRSGHLSTLTEDGLAKARTGLTTVEEVVRSLAV